MRVVLTVGLLLMVAMAGCSDRPLAGDQLPTGPAASLPLEWTFEADGSMEQVDLPGDAAFQTTGRVGAEPNIGVTSSGAIFVTAYDDTLRSTDGVRWEPVYSFEPPLGSGNQDTGDPMLWVDPVTDIVYSNHMYPGLVCFSTAWSSDDGDSWVQNDETCTLPGVDHQKFFTAIPGPAAPAVAGDEHPTVLYQCSQKAVGTEQTGILVAGYTTHCNMSYDGGETWDVETVSATRIPGGASCGGLNGHPASAPDGTVVVPITRGCDGLYISVSLDSGLSWTVRPGPKSVGAQSIDPEVAFTPDGTLYAMWRGDDQLPYMARSSDLGVTWAGPWLVSPPHVTGSVFQVMSAGDDGTVAMAYLATDSYDGDPSDAPHGTLWHLVIVVSDDADSDAPTFDAYQVTPPANPVQNGCVWLRGGGSPCRNMLDFMDSAVDMDGRFLVAFTKGCSAGCVDEEDKTSIVSMARLNERPITA